MNNRNKETKILVFRDLPLKYAPAANIVMLDGLRQKKKFGKMHDIIWKKIWETILLHFRQI